MELAVARIARIRPGLAGLEGVATLGGAEERKAWVALHRARRTHTLSGELRMVVY
jgi:hypothetical protein